MPKKLPYFPFYPGDYLKDPALTLCSAATRGIWMDLLCRMHEYDRSGELRGTADQLARLARCSTVEFVLAATDLKDTNTAEVIDRNGSFTIRNRRMWEESNGRKANAERQMRFRNGESNTKKTASSVDEYESEFEEFWNEFPKGRRKSKGAAKESFFKAAKRCDPATIIEAAKAYAASDEGRGKFVKMPSTWLNQECWNDDREAWRDKDKPASETAYREISREDFAEHVRMKRFKDGPMRHGTNPNWFFGTLRTGEKVICKEPKSSPPPVPQA